jgi:hypothetical protein
MRMRIRIPDSKILLTPDRGWKKFGFRINILDLNHCPWPWAKLPVAIFTVPNNF